MGAEFGSLPDQGWIDELLAQDLGKCLEYGRYLGKRYEKFDNIMWVMGGDRRPGPALERLNVIALGIKEYDKRHLFTGHVQPESSPADEFSNGGWLDVNNTYSYSIVHRRLLIDYNRTPVMATFLMESAYEGEHNSSEVQIRRQAYWSVLSGGFGHVFGNNPVHNFDAPIWRRVWPSEGGWQAAMDRPGSISMVHWGNLFRSLAWHDLIPDQKHEVVTKGLGEFRGLDYLFATYSADRKLVIVYIPTFRSIEIDLTKMSGSVVRAWWFDPRTGVSISAGDFATSGSRVFAPPTEGDWVFVLDDASKRPSPPGKTVNGQT